MAKYVKSTAIVFRGRPTLKNLAASKHEPVNRHEPFEIFDVHTMAGKRVASDIGNGRTLKPLDRLNCLTGKLRERFLGTPTCLPYTLQPRGSRSSLYASFSTRDFGVGIHLHCPGKSLHFGHDVRGNSCHFPTVRPFRNATAVLYPSTIENINSPRYAIPQYDVSRGIEK